MKNLRRIEYWLCRAFVMATYPIVVLGQMWMERVNLQDEYDAGNPDALVLDRPDFTVADIRPAGMVKVHAMGPDGTWDEIHDYPVRLLPKVPGVTIRRGE